MYKSIFLLLLIILTAVFVNSCSKTIDPKLNDVDPLIVVNAIFSPDSIVKVNVSKSISILENEWEIDPPYLQDANVDLFENDQLIATLQYDDGGDYLFEDFFPDASKKYSIDVSESGLQSVHANLDFPEMVPIQSVETEIEEVYYDSLYSEERLKFTINYDDPLGRSNFYLLEMYMNYSDENGGFHDKVYFDIPEIDRDKFDVAEDFLLWSDFLSDGQHVEITGYTYFYSDGGDYSGDGKDVSLEFHLKSLNEDYYLYKKTAYLARSSGFDNPFVEPVQVYSNIENGMGIFSAYTSSVYFVNPTN